MKQIRISVPSLALLVAVVGGGAFAAGRALPGDSTSPVGAKPDLGARESQEPREWQELQPVQETDPLPPGHPPIDDRPSSGRAEQTGEPDTVGDDPAEEAPLQWKAPPRWQLVPNASAMRLATYRVPRAPGDAADGEVAIARAGGSVDANAERWIRQFDPAGQATAKRTKRKVGALDVAIVEVRGAFLGGMGKDGQSRPGWMLLGAIVSLPTMPCFIKLTGPEKSVLAARGEFDGFIGSLAMNEHGGT